MTKSILTQERLKELLHYDPDTGVFTWKIKRKGTKGVGTEAGDVHRSGYRRISVDYKRYFSHRLAWLYVYGEWPENDIDHINQDTLDNRISNLRDVPNRINHLNMSRMSNNTSGVTGVSFNKRSGKWAAFIHTNKKMTHLGLFSSKDDAITARKDEEIARGYHINHGSEKNKHRSAVCAERKHWGKKRGPKPPIS